MFQAFFSRRKRGERELCCIDQPSAVTPGPMSHRSGRLLAGGGEGQETRTRETTLEGGWSSGHPPLQRGKGLHRTSRINQHLQPAAARFSQPAQPARSIAAKIESPHTGLPTKSSASASALLPSAAPDSPRLALNPFCQPEQRDDGLGLCLRRDCPCSKPLKVSSSPILSSHIPRLSRKANCPVTRCRSPQR